MDTYCFVIILLSIFNTITGESSQISVQYSCQNSAQDCINVCIRVQWCKSGRFTNDGSHLCEVYSYYRDKYLNSEKEFDRTFRVWVSGVNIFVIWILNDNNINSKKRLKVNKTIKETKYINV